ncbi:MAG TPA: oxygenase MpaB family protein [Allosphingosinicella sp.]|jgi:uncharacterized protein (DUF2236 family)
MQILQRMIREQVVRLVGDESEAPATWAGPGLFPPHAVCRTVHGDFTTMLTGGVAALAGVWDHSNFRQDTTGRLKRTAQFLAGTTYGSAGEAERLIARIRAIHDHVHGVLPDGTPYSANDPALLTWVHIAGVRSFLEAYLRHGRAHLSPRDQDRYYAETSLIAYRLGATSVPETRRAVEEYLAEMRPQLRVDARTREVARVLMRQRAPSAGLAPFRDVVMQSAVGLLPPWAARMHGLHVPELRRPALDLSIRGFGALTRWALQG